jgi:hypothetical protein
LFLNLETEIPMKTLKQPRPQPVVEAVRRLRAGELSQVGEALTEKEMKAVAGAAMGVTWQCGRPKRDDEWN